MKNLSVVIASMALFASCVSGTVKQASLTRNPDTESTKADEVENGLLPPVLQRGQAIKPMTLRERMGHYSVPGVSIAVINNGGIAWTQSYGSLEQGTQRAVTKDSRFQAASISKSVATLGLLTLVEKGKLTLDEPINKRLKGWQIPEDDLTKPHAITLRQILTHSAGFNVHGFDGYERGRDKVPSLRQVLDGIAPANSDAIHVIYTPGKRFVYSGGGYEVLQQLITDVTQKPFDLFMRDTVLKPLQMHASTYELISEENAGDFATAHDSKGNPVPGKWHDYPESAAAGLWTTPTDLAKFIIEIQNALKKRSQLGISKALASTMISRIIEDRGLGVVVRGNGSERYFTHSGGNAGFKSLFVGYADLGLGAVVMTNGEQGSKLAGEIMRSIANAYKWPNYLVEVAPIPESPKSATQDYAKYVGQYLLDPETLISVSERDGHLFAKLGEDSPSQAYPEAESRFVFLDKSVEVIFPKRQARGGGLIWRQSGIDHFAPRLGF